MNYPTHAKKIEIFIITRREGLLTKVGHDLLLSVKPSEFSADGDHFEGTVNPKDIVVHGAWSEGKVESMSKGDVSKIEKIMLKDVFKVKKFSTIRFSGFFSDPLNVELYLVGQKGALVLTKEDADWTGVLDHSKFGIPQVKALLGTLKVSPEVELRVHID